MSGLAWNKDRLQITAILWILQLLKPVFEDIEESYDFNLKNNTVFDTDVAPIW